jgi:hypothetical protein
VEGGVAKEVLFNRNSIHQITQQYPRLAIERAGRFTESELLNNSTDHLIEVIQSEFVLDIPELVEEEACVEEKEVDTIRRPSRYGDFVDFH